MSAERALRVKLGDEGMAGLHIVVEGAGRQWKDDVLAITGERFERRLAQEIGALRVDMAKEFSATRLVIASGLADTRTSILKWCFLFWVGQVAAMTGIMALLTPN